MTWILLAAVVGVVALNVRDQRNRESKEACARQLERVIA